MSREAPTRYHKIAYDGGLIEALLGFLEAQARPPQQIILDLDATDDPLHGHQEPEKSSGKMESADGQAQGVTHGPPSMRKVWSRLTFTLPSGA